ncbi:MAG: hypothetical protein VB065_01185, partial [Eubacteriales bacterium]|nr:hypothetical protein [Eubacteriales bacterium]
MQGIPNPLKSNTNARPRASAVSRNCARIGAKERETATVILIKLTNWQYRMIEKGNTGQICRKHKRRTFYVKCGGGG